MKEALNQIINAGVFVEEDTEDWDCNINLKLTKKIPVIFDNLRGCDSHLIMQEIGKFDVKISVIPNELGKYMAFTINKNLVFVDSRQFMNSSLHALVKNLSDNDFKYLLQESGGQSLVGKTKRRVSV